MARTFVIGKMRIAADGPLAARILRRMEREARASKSPEFREFVDYFVHVVAPGGGTEEEVNRLWERAKKAGGV